MPESEPQSQRRVPLLVKGLLAAGGLGLVVAGCQRIDIRDAGKYEYEQDIMLNFTPPLLGKEVFIDNHSIDDSEKIEIGNVRECAEVNTVDTENQEEEDNGSIGFRDFYDLSKKAKVTLAVEAMNCSDEYAQEDYCPTVPLLITTTLQSSESEDSTDTTEELVPVEITETKAICFDYSQAVAYTDESIVVPLATKTYESGDTVEQGELVTNCRALRFEASDLAKGVLSRIIAGERRVPNREFMEAIDNIDVSVNYDSSAVIKKYCDELRAEESTQGDEILIPVTTLTEE